MSPMNDSWARIPNTQLCLHVWHSCVCCGCALQPVPWKMKLEMVIGMQIEILNGIMKLPFHGSFHIFKRKETENNTFMIPFRISSCIPITISSLVFHGTGCMNHSYVWHSLAFRQLYLHVPCVTNTCFEETTFNARGQCRARITTSRAMR